MFSAYNPITCSLFCVEVGIVASVFLRKCWLFEFFSYLLSIIKNDIVLNKKTLFRQKISYYPLTTFFYKNAYSPRNVVTGRSRTSLLHCIFNNMPVRKRQKKIFKKNCGLKKGRFYDRVWYFHGRHQRLGQLITVQVRLSSPWPGPGTCWNLVAAALRWVWPSPIRRSNTRESTIGGLRRPMDCQYVRLSHAPWYIYRVSQRTRAIYNYLDQRVSPTPLVSCPLLNLFTRQISDLRS